MLSIPKLLCMNQIPKQNCCQDYTLFTANTHITNVAAANPHLDGSGTLSTVIVPAGAGTIVKSVIIKAIGPVTTGMVRFFIYDGTSDKVLYKEVPIPVTPQLHATPTPTPVLPMYQMKMDCDCLLLEGHKTLVASTQTGDIFILIAEGLDRTYPDPLPPACCNYEQNGGSTGATIISKANRRLDGAGVIEQVLKVPPGVNGVMIKSITIKALQSTSINGMVRLFISSDGGTSYLLMQEIPVPETTQSAYEPSFKVVIDMNYCLQEGFVIGAATQNAEAFGITAEAEKWVYPTF